MEGNSGGNHRKWKLSNEPERVGTIVNAATGLNAYHVLLVAVGRLAISIGI